MPTGVVFTTRSAPRSASAMNSSAVVLCAGPSATSAAARSGVRDQMAQWHSGHALMAATTARAEPPAPSTATLTAFGRLPSSARTASSKPPTSVLSPCSMPSTDHQVFTAPSRRASGVNSSQSAATDSLCGIVTLPAACAATSARSVSARFAALTSTAAYKIFRPAARSAAFWNTGESECATGCPSSTSCPGVCISENAGPGLRPVGRRRDRSAHAARRRCHGRS